MSDNKAKLTAIITLIAAVSVVPVGAAAQSSGSSGGASSGGGSAGGAASGGSSSAGGAPSPSIGRAGPATGTRSGTATTNDPRALGNQPATAISPSGTAPGTYAPGGTPAPAGSTAPSGTAYPSGPGLEAARQRAMQSPPGTQIPPSSAGVGSDRSRTSNVGSGQDATDATPGLPNQANPNRADSPNELTAGGTPRQGAVGKTMAECEAAWDSKTHMSKETWRDTCRRTLTEPHL